MTFPDAPSGRTPAGAAGPVGCQRFRAADPLAAPTMGVTPVENMTGLEFKRGGRCDNSGPNCVEVADGADGMRYLRDSKNPGTVLAFNSDEWAAFTGSVRDGDFG